MNIINIKRTAFGEGNITATGDLGETGETGLDGEKKRAVAIMTEFTRNEGARTDEGDVTTKDIK